jgi:predicted nucleic acid-binding protein
MAAFVLDASATLAWCFQDEATPWSDALLDRLRKGDQGWVPAHWSIEISSAFWSAHRRKRFSLDDIRGFWDDLGQLPIQREPDLAPSAARAVIELAVRFDLTPYDAAYLDLAIRLGLPLATLDTALQKVAPIAGVILL